MSEHYNGFDPELDALLEESRRQANSAPGQINEPVPPAAAQEEAEFTPDFGDAFVGYGTYEAPVANEGAPAEAYDNSYDEGYDEEYYDEDYEDERGEAVPTIQKPRRKKRKRIVPLFVKILLYLVIVGLVAVGSGYGVWECAQDVLALGRSDETLTVTIPQGATVEDVAQLLQDKGVIKYAWLFEFYCDFTDSNDRMDPGTYQISYNYDYHALVSGLAASSPNRTTVRVTIPEGMTCAQIFALMEKNNVCTVAELETAAANSTFDYWFLEDIPYGQSNRLEGFLFPDTYDFYESDDPERVLNKLLANFDRKFSDEAQAQLEALNEQLAQRWANAGYDEAYITAHRFSIYELMTVSSMIERETAGSSESSDIASVIYNRLCHPADYPYLNIDATVVYALGGVTGPLTEADLQVDSPYNTYTNTGLPYGPIANPGLSSITAALNPSNTDYYFYALDNTTGYHHFSETYAEHNEFLGSEAGQ